VGKESLGNGPTKSLGFFRKSWTNAKFAGNPQGLSKFGAHWSRSHGLEKEKLTGAPVDILVVAEMELL
jgi:hypothetical protein